MSVETWEQTASRLQRELEEAQLELDVLRTVRDSLRTVRDSLTESERSLLSSLEEIWLSIPAALRRPQNVEYFVTDSVKDLVDKYELECRLRQNAQDALDVAFNTVPERFRAHSGDLFVCIDRMSATIREYEAAATRSECSGGCQHRRYSDERGKQMLEVRKALWGDNRPNGYAAPGAMAKEIKQIKDERDAERVARQRAERKRQILAEELSRSETMAESSRARITGLMDEIERLTKSRESDLQILRQQKEGLNEARVELVKVERALEGIEQDRVGDESVSAWAKRVLTTLHGRVRSLEDERDRWDTWKDETQKAILETGYPTLMHPAAVIRAQKEGNTTLAKRVEAAEWNALRNDAPPRTDEQDILGDLVKYLKGMSDYPGTKAQAHFRGKVIGWIEARTGKSL